MNVHELRTRLEAGEVVATCEELEPWKITKCSRATWYRFMASGRHRRGWCCDSADAG